MALSPPFDVVLLAYLSDFGCAFWPSKVLKLHNFINFKSLGIFRETAYIVIGPTVRARICVGSATLSQVSMIFAVVVTCHIERRTSSRCIKSTTMVVSC